jgi:hypothetical protein
MNSTKSSTAVDLEEIFMQHVIEAPFEIKSLDWADASGQLVPKIKNILRGGNAALITGFPLDEQSLVDLAGQLGQPLLNYNKKSDIDAGASRNPYINLVKLAGDAEAHRLLHGKGGPLLIHSARSWLAPRPKLFALLMVDEGWRGNPSGQNGESLFVPYSEVFAAMAAKDPERFREAFHILKSRRVRFEADNVREQVSDLPIVYPLEDSRHELDLGVRLKQNIVDKLATVELFGAEPGSLRDAVGWLQQTAYEVAQRNRITLKSGQLVIIDNNRWGHGRCGYPATREIEGDTRTNPRQVWSLALA